MTEKKNSLIQEQREEIDPVDQVVGSMAIEGFRITDEEKEILRNITTGELNADEFVEKIVRNARLTNTSK